MFVKIAIVTVSMLTAAGAASAAEQPATKKAGAQTEKRYCIQYENITGSRVAAQECRTKAEWARRGVDVGSSTKN